MDDLAEEYLDALLRKHWNPVAIRVDSAGVVSDISGSLIPYGFAGLAVGTILEEHLPYVAGLLPHQGEPLVLPWVQTDKGRYIDIHLLQERESSCVLLIESQLQQEERVHMQQQGNLLALEQHKQGRLLEHHLGQFVADQLRHNELPFAPEGERREATLLFCDIRDFTTYAEQNTPQQVFQTLHCFMKAMVSPILEQGGWLDKLAGDAVYSVFGITPANGEGTPAARAVAAAVQIMKNVQQANQRRVEQGLPALGVGIGITTGQVAVGILGTDERRQFVVIGHHVNLAARLQGQSRAFEMLIDGRTLSELGSEKAEFTQRSLILKGVREPMPAFSLFPLNSQLNHDGNPGRVSGHASNLL